MQRPDLHDLSVDAAGFDPIEAFGALDDTTRANVVGTIVGHPEGAPSKKEVEYYNPSVAPSTLTGHLNELEERRIVEVIERERAGLDRGEPYRFFRLTDEARELFDRNGLFDEEAYRALFEEVEKTEEIRVAESVERPVSS